MRVSNPCEVFPQASSTRACARYGVSDFAAPMEHAARAFEQGRHSQTLPTELPKKVTSASDDRAEQCALDFLVLPTSYCRATTVAEVFAFKASSSEDYGTTTLWLRRHRILHALRRSCAPLSKLQWPRQHQTHVARMSRILYRENTAVRQGRR